MTLWAQASGGAMLSLADRPVGIRVANAVVSAVAYLGDTIWPAGLAVPYPFMGEA